MQIESDGSKAVAKKRDYHGENLCRRDPVSDVGSMILDVVQLLSHVRPLRHTLAKRSPVRRKIEATISRNKIFSLYLLANNIKHWWKDPTKIIITGSLSKFQDKSTAVITDCQCNFLLKRRSFSQILSNLIKKIHLIIRLIKSLSTIFIRDNNNHDNSL